MSSELFPKTWKLQPLEEVMEAIIDYRGKTPTKTEHGIPLITAKIVKNGSVQSPTEFIAEENYDTWMVRGLPEVGDVVLTTEAPLGETAQLTSSKVALAQRIVTLRGKKGVLDNDFLLCAMQSKYVQNQLEARATGSTVKGIKQSELRKVLIPIPPLEQQLNIAGTLKSLSDKILLNIKTNQTLEQIAQAIFKSWFVDFDPVKAKIAVLEAGGTKEQAELAAMSVISAKDEAALKKLQAEQPDAYAELAQTAALFPSKMVGSELGEIPEGWERGALGDICAFTAGSAFKPEYQGSSEGDYPFIKVSDMNLAGNEVFIQSANNYVSKAQQSEMKAKLHTLGATVFAKIGVALASNRRRLLTTPTIIDNNMMSASPIDEISGQYFLYSLLCTIDFNTLASGTALPYLNVSDLKKIPIVRPSSVVFRAFELKASSIFSMVYTLAVQSSTLSLTRDALLPNLLSGELIGE